MKAGLHLGQNKIMANNISSLERIFFKNWARLTDPFIICKYTAFLHKGCTTELRPGNKLVCFPRTYTLFSESLAYD